METPYLEANALLALISEEDERAEQIVEELLPGEARALARAARELAALADERARR